jgi:uncharacterized membrane protein
MGGATFGLQAGARGAGPFSVMRRTKQIFAAAFVVLGAMLVVKGVWGGLWPVSYQLLAGIALLVFGILRLRTL